MTLRHLKIFIQVCKHNSFSKAADELNMSQPAVSAAIKELEHYYDVRLFDRVNHRIYITESGQSLLSYATRIISDLNEAYFNIKRTNQQTVLKVGCNISFGSTLFPEIIETFSKKYPNIQVCSTIANSKSIEQKLLNHELDLAIVDNLNISSNFKCKLIARENMIMVCGPEYYEMQIKNNSHIELLEQRYLMREKGSGTRDSVDELFENINIVPNISMESTSNSALINGAIHNLGIAILPEMYVQTYLESGKLLKLDVENIDFLRHYFLIYHHNRYLSASMKCFINQFE